MSKNTSQTLPFNILLSGSVVLCKLYVETECEVSMGRQCMWDAIVLEDILYIYTLRPWMNVSEAVWWILFTQAVIKLTHCHKRGYVLGGRSKNIIACPEKTFLYVYLSIRFSFINATFCTFQANINSAIKWYRFLKSNF